MIVRDWTQASRDVTAPLYDRRRRERMRALGWDSSGSWRDVETARTTWGLPGLLAEDEAGRVRGWAFYMADGLAVHIGGLVADTPRATRALLDRILTTSEAVGAESLSGFIFDEASGLMLELARRGFEVEPFLYLARDLTASSRSVRLRPDSRSVRLQPDRGDAPVAAGVWHPDDVVVAAALLREAYGPDAGRHFAPGHTPGEWERYVRNLVEQTACGTLDTRSTRVIRSSSGMDALVLVTAIAERTAHLAQVAVHPSRQGQRLAQRLVLDVCEHAADRGFTSATLLVAASNVPARRLYDQLGFVPRARFVAARKILASQPVARSFSSASEPTG
jgi:ribosomal protein S18 acetylase RimI-like enzyme